MDILKDWVKRLLYRSGYYKWVNYVRTRSNKRLLILMYHDLIDHTELAAAATVQEKITLAQFRASVNSISGHYRTLTVQQAINEINEDGDLRENSVAITFDDGYSTFYSIAYPILRQYDVPATVFLPTNWINHQTTLWWDDLAEMIECSEYTAVDQAKVRHLLTLGGDKLMTRPNLDIASKRGFYLTLSFMLMQMDESSKRSIIKELGGLLPRRRTPGHRKARPLTWAEIRVLARNGIEFGAHTCSHLNMSFCDLATAREEIGKSKTEIERQLNREVRGFAYPYGYDLTRYQRFEPLFRDLGLDYACSSWPGCNSVQTDRYLLRRGILSRLESPPLLGRELQKAMAG